MTSYRNTHVISFSEAVGDFRSGQQTPRRLLERCLERIEAREGEVKAFVSLNVKGARAAADASSARYRAGSPLSAIDGCPISVKDIMDTHDMPTQMGSPIYKDWRPRVDAVCVQALRSGGAVILGKTVTTEFACGAVGPTVNPHDPARTPGGSSSGSAAAVGAGMVPVALGTQTQGSTLRPASYCGVVGFKPTHGILPMAGIHPISPTHDHLGVIAGTLKDTWRAASHIALMAQDPRRDFARGKMADLPSPVRPSRLIRFYTKGWEETAAETRAAFDALVSKVERAGVEVVSRINNARVADLEKILDEGFIEHSLDITAYEMKWPYEQYVGRYEELIAQRIRDRIAKARCMTAEYYQHLLVEKETIRQQLSEVLKGADGIITLAASGPAPLGLDSTGSRTFLTYATFLGLPAFSLPLMAIDNLPLGLQIIGDRGRDSALCSLAGWLMREIVYA